MNEEEIAAYAKVALAKQKRARERFDRRRAAREFYKLAEGNIAALSRSRMLGGKEGEWKISESDGCLTVMSERVFVRHCFLPEPSGFWSCLCYALRRLDYARLGKARYHDRHWSALAEKIAVEDARRQVYEDDEMPAGLVMASERQELGAQVGQAPGGRAKSL